MFDMAAMPHARYGRIYTDYDGVVANFTKAASQKIGMDIESPAFSALPREVIMKKFRDACDTVAFWADLETMPDYATYWGYVKYWSPGVITAYPDWGKDSIETAKRGKAIWNRRHTMVPESRFHVVRRADKKRFAMEGGMPNVLIDDHEKNIDEWERAGGTGILHTGAVATIVKLKMLGFNKT